MAKISTCNPPLQLWIDLPDADEKIEKFYKQERITALEKEQLTQFKNEGYVIFPHAIDDALTDQMVDDLTRLFEQGAHYLLRMPKGEVIHPHGAVNPPKSRLLDLYANNETCRKIALAQFIQRFLHLLYEEPPLLFQSLLFTWGTEHSIHADNTYIVCNPPCALIACWFAFEDVIPGSGELAYYPKSHKLPLVTFESDRIQWRPHTDGKLAHLEYTDFLKDRSSSIGEPQYFLAKTGDVMIWHANLVHYGCDITLHDQTRKSMLTHYCPALSGNPNYFKFFKQAFKRPWEMAYYSSRRYDIRPDITNPLPVYKK